MKGWFFVRRYSFSETVAALAIVAGIVLSGSGDAEAAVDYNRDIRPILSDACFKCHGPDKNTREADLRLDTFAGAIADLGDYAAVVPGKPDESELLERLHSTDRKEVMPPPKTGRQLTDAEKALLRQWIKEGAKYDRHWSLVKVKKPKASGMKDAWIKNAIDAFILRRLKEERVSPSREADRVTLIRRLSFDLTGLPPTPAEVKAFVSDRSPKAYENIVARLLKSKHFGERLAQYWLDVVRFADSNGYHSDEARSVGPFRDYVIDAFNNNKRYDVFIREQLAGDLMKNAGVEQRVASGFNMLLQTTNEGGAQEKEYLAKYVADRVRNTSTIFLGLTMGCCECHDHKYDPFTAKDFYSMGAFFADIRERGRGNPPTFPVPARDQKERLAGIDKQIAALKVKAKVTTPEIAAAQGNWEVQISQKIKGGLRTDLVWVDDAKVPNGKKEGGWNYITKKQGPVYSGKQSRRQVASDLVQHFVIGARNKLTIGKGDVFFFYVWLDKQNPTQTVMLQINDGSWEHRAYWGADRIPFGRGNGPSHKRMGDLPTAGKWTRLEVKASDIGVRPGAKINGIAFTQYGGLVYWDKAGVNQSGSGLTDELVAILKKEKGKRTAAEASRLAAYYRSQTPRNKAIARQIESLKRQKTRLMKNQPRTLMTVSTKPRMIRVLPRGNWMDNSGAVVTPAIPETLGKLNVKGRATRLDLANWIASKDNPLTARTLVNRLWMLFYGSGLSSRLDDLGAQGDSPSHPELLDWLASEFVESGWNIKHIITIMVTSATYRQSSMANSILTERDPMNRLFARQGRWRLDAEMVRDNALAISGLLDRTIGGRSVKPYQPAGYWRHMNFPKRRWNADSGGNLYRRGLYTWWQRMFLHPSLAAFDAPSREESCVQRTRSNTPQQALALLNDPTYVEAARVFAVRIMDEGGKTFESKLNWAYLAATSRAASRAEVALLKPLYRLHRSQYKVDPAAAKALLAVGQKPAPAGIDAAELAAWTSVARVVLNLHETITRR